MGVYGLIACCEARLKELTPGESDRAPLTPLLALLVTICRLDRATEESIRAAHGSGIARVVRLHGLRGKDGITCRFHSRRTRGGADRHQWHSTNSRSLNKRPVRAATVSERST